MKTVCAVLCLPHVASLGDFRKGFLTIRVSCLLDSIVVEPIEHVVTQLSQIELPLTVEVVMSSMATARYELFVPMDSTLLEVLQILQEKDVGFT